MEKKFERKLAEIVDDIYEAATDVCDWSWYELARAAGVSYGTVSKLGNRITKSPHLRTVFKLAKAVGMDLELVEEHIHTGLKVAA